jgi:hypothetical protein
MTDQEMFDTILTHLRQQGLKSVGSSTEGPTCRYRTKDGRKCAVGCMIPDDKYSREIEGHYPSEVNRVLDMGWTRDQERFLLVAQSRLHDALDRHNFPAQLEKAAEQFAEVNGLTYREPATT